jgi:Valyl-tRNA synthetase
VQVIDENGRMMENTGRFAGMTVTEARKAVVEAMKEMDLIERIDESYQTSIAHCYKCGAVIEPMLKDQWFISVKPLTEKAIQAIEDGKIKFTPKQKGRELIQYYKELRDWNISRQIPWGISIPAFRRVGDQEPAASEWIFDTRVDQEEIEVNGAIYRRDEDTFDTWFSSGQWPYIVTRGDLERFYPSSVMETGMDILRPWVARMMMLGLYISDEVPFKDVYLHGLVNDERNQKMSKSKGNVINPMDVVEEYGSDAMRLGIIANRSAALSQAFSPATVVAGRNFCNKLWNIARYIGSRVELEFDLVVIDEDLDKKYIANMSIAEHWVFRQIDNARKNIEKMLAEYRFAEAYEILYHVVWDDVADWFIEASKLDNDSDAIAKSLLFVLKFILKLAHPFTPFVTETVWQSLENVDKNTSLLILQQWPEKLKYNDKKAAEFEQIIEIVREVRRANIDLGGAKRSLASNDKFVLDNSDLIKFLARLENVGQGQSGLKLRLADFEVYISAADTEIKKYDDNLIKIESEAKAKIIALEARLANKSYVKNAPAELVEETRAELEKLKSSY